MNVTISLVFCFVAVIILAACIVAVVISYRKLNKQYENLQMSYQNLERLNNTLRSQRHDYLNHLQVVYGLMQLEEYEELEKYLEPVYKDMQKTGKALKTSKPAINALLKAKMDEASSKEIDFYVEVKSDLKSLEIEDWELCKVISNIVDNAITALEEKTEQKKIMLDITEDKEFYRFSIANNGPMIPLDMQPHIFRQGVTTKLEREHGMGLYIVMNVIKKYDGTIKMTSTEEETKFVVMFPKRKKVNVNG